MSGPARPRHSVLALWSGAFLAAVIGHVAVAAIALNWTPAASAPAAAPPVITIDLAPLSVPPVPEQQLAPGPQAADSPQPAPPEKAAESEPRPSSLPEKQEPVAILPPPMPEARPETRLMPNERQHDVKKEDRKKTGKLASRAAAPATFQAPRSASATAPAAGAARVPLETMASWRNELMAQLNRHKRYPPGTDRNGTAMVAFTVNRSGEVTSARLIGSSGDGTLDQEAVALPRRASPLPKPPQGVSSASIALTVPIHFAPH